MIRQPTIRLAPAVNLRPHFLDELGGDLLTLGMLATACVCVGFLFNQMRDQPLPLVYVPKETRLKAATNRLQAIDPHPALGFPPEPSSANASRQAVPLPSIDLNQFQQLVLSKSGLVLDARPEIFYRLGHVPGALSVSREEFARNYADHRAVLEAARNEAMVVYCSGASCEDSRMVAEALNKLGYRRVQVFQGGWEEWKRAGLPEERR